MPYNNTNFAVETNVSRETLSDYETWQTLLEKWNKRINLVSAGALGDFWQRHALDSWQICGDIPDTAKTMLDLGSGGGFPGIAIAIHAKEQGRGHVTLVESAGKKANFLRAIIRELDLPAVVWAGRAEDLAPDVFDVISARAFAPLPRLFEHANRHWGAQTVALLLKGQGAKEELTESAKWWTYDVTSTPSRSDDTGVLLKIQGLQKKP